MYTIRSRRGFTLTELLVVVLIIGILASVALPQYQLAVDKSKAAECMSGLKTLRAAEEAYYLANGQLASGFSELDIDFPGKPSEVNGDLQRVMKNGTWYDISGEYVLCGISSASVHLMAFRGTANFGVYKGQYFCRSYSSRGKKVCQTMGSYMGVASGVYDVFVIH